MWDKAVAVWKRKIIRLLRRNEGHIISPGSFLLSPPNSNANIFSALLDCQYAMIMPQFGLNTQSSLAHFLGNYRKVLSSIFYHSWCLI